MTTETVGRGADSTAGDRRDPLAAADASELFLASPRGTLIARDAIAAADTTRLADIAPDATELLAGCVRDLSARARASGAPLLVGAVPFAAEAAARLVVARDIEWAPRLSGVRRGAVPKAVRVDLVPWPDRYTAGVERAMARLTGKHKVVLARAIDVITAEPARAGELVRSLVCGEPDAYVFAVPVGTQRSGARRVLVGASPELVVRRAGRSVVSNPLAGSVPRSSDPVEDRERAAQLLHSRKDLHEHRIVVEAVADALRPLCAALEVPATPSVLHTSTMWHLSTQVRGVLRDPRTNALELAAALHPTPAVCGWPTDAARRLIAEAEAFDRQFYCGLTGWMNAAGDGEWVLALRCAEVADTRMRLYAGAGVVEGSAPAAELAETSAKFRTFLTALGLDPGVAVDPSAVRAK